MISIIVPVYKVEPYLRQCVDSILNQTYRDIEVLLIDDGSPDRCGEICDEYAKKDQRIRVFHTENKGLSAARNLGLREAKGEYIGFVDSDDWIEPDMYEVLLKRMQETGADISVCGMWYEFVNRSIESNCNECMYGSDKESMYALICGDIKTQVMNKLWTLHSALQLQFPEGQVYEDISSVYKVILRVDKIATVHQSLYRYRQRKGSIARVYPMKNLMDYWNAYHDRYEHLMKDCENIVRGDIESELRKQCANAIARTWRWFYSVPQMERDYSFLKTIHIYTIRNYRHLGDKGWPVSLKVCIFLAHYKNMISLGLTHVMNLFFWNVKFRQSLWA